MPRKRVQPIAPSEVLDHLRHFIESRNMQPGQRLPAERSSGPRVPRRASVRPGGDQGAADSRRTRQPAWRWYLHQVARRALWRMAFSGGSRRTKHRFNRSAGSAKDDRADCRRAFRCTAQREAARGHGSRSGRAREAPRRPRESGPPRLPPPRSHPAGRWESSVLQDVARFLAPLLLRSRKLTGKSAPNPRIAIQQHRIILEAIRRRDPDSAEQAMRNPSADRRARSDLSGTFAETHVTGAYRRCSCFFAARSSSTIRSSMG